MFNPFSQLRAKLWATDTTEAPDPAPLDATDAPDVADAFPLPEEYRIYLEANRDLPTPFLNALDTRSPSYLDIIAYLIDTGKTPATRQDVQASFLAVHKRLPGPAELESTVKRVQEFGLEAS
ncbi:MULTISPECIES: hypothetical protein [unclassified Corynebacterium]|uniref:hypothetical protein n=1 Tax=unclassified Corynebacterium TaxID=2624378 RepID=UPI001EF4C674|nr:MULTISPECIES: hypothetical protein [unclassified Corynebacterium]MCG7258399.1 hypothetical protein [Corynebacterium sp. ACRQK]MCG7262944.1 hypothetical protein [Corynebacterium sp. ACRQL]